MADFIEDSRDDGTGVLRVAGDVDLAVADRFVEAARACLDRRDAIELDLSGVTFIDSSGLGALVRLRKEATERSKRLHLTNVSASVQRLLELTGLHHVFEPANQDPHRAGHVD